jgi:hypothetical protein
MAPARLPLTADTTTLEQSVPQISSFPNRAAGVIFMARAMRVIVSN